MESRSAQVVDDHRTVAGGDKQERVIDPRFAEYARTGDRRLRDALIVDHRWLAVHCARRFANKGEPLDDLVQVAQLGLLKAVDRFDPDRRLMFTTFAVPTIVGELRRHFRDKTWAVRVPRSVKENQQHLGKIVDQLTQTLGRSPSVPELAKRAGLSVEDALMALEANNSYRGVPLSSPSSSSSSGRATRSGDHDGGADIRWDDPRYDATDARLTVQRLLAGLTDERERRLLEMRFFEGLSQSEIGTRLGVSQVHVSRLLTQSLQKLRSRLTAS